MGIVNHSGVPDLIFKAMARDAYQNQGSHYSATGLIRPPRVKQLSDRHADQIETDVSKIMLAFTGSAIHNYIEWRIRSNPDADYKLEWRLFDKLLGRKVSGQPDIMRIDSPEGPNKIWDIKTTSAWSVFYGRKEKNNPYGIKEDWIKQINIYAFLVWQDMAKVIEEGAVLAWYRDWDKTKVGEGGGTYPSIWAEELPIPMWSTKEQEDYVMDRLSMHIAAETVLDDELLHCTDEEMWAKATKYAVKVPNGKRALRVFDEVELAEALVKERASDKAFIEVRPGTHIRCEDYCDGKYFCNQFKEYKLEEVRNAQV